MSVRNIIVVRGFVDLELAGAWENFLDTVAAIKNCCTQFPLEGTIEVLADCVPIYRVESPATLTTVMCVDVLHGGALKREHEDTLESEMREKGVLLSFTFARHMSLSGEPINPKSKK